MNYMERLNWQYVKGLNDGQKSNYRPGSIFGAFHDAYKNGYNQGIKMQKLSKSYFKAK